MAEEIYNNNTDSQDASAKNAPATKEDASGKGRGKVRGKGKGKGESGKESSCGNDQKDYQKVLLQLPVTYLNFGNLKQYRRSSKLNYGTVKHKRSVYLYLREDVAKWGYDKFICKENKDIYLQNWLKNIKAALKNGTAVAAQSQQQQQAAAAVTTQAQFFNPVPGHQYPIQAQSMLQVMPTAPVGQFAPSDPRMFILLGQPPRLLPDYWDGRSFTATGNYQTMGEQMTRWHIYPSCQTRIQDQVSPQNLLASPPPQSQPSTSLGRNGQ